MTADPTSARYAADVALGFALRTLSEDDGARFLAVWNEHYGPARWAAPILEVRTATSELDAIVHSPTLLDRIAAIMASQRSVSQGSRRAYYRSLLQRLLTAVGEVADERTIDVPAARITGVRNRETGLVSPTPAIKDAHSFVRLKRGQGDDRFEAVSAPEPEWTVEPST